MQWPDQVGREDTEQASEAGHRKKYVTHVKRQWLLIGHSFLLVSESCFGGITDWGKSAPPRGILGELVCSHARAILVASSSQGIQLVCLACPQCLGGSWNSTNKAQQICAQVYQKSRDFNWWLDYSEEGGRYTSWSEYHQVVPSPWALEAQWATCWIFTCTNPPHFPPLPFAIGTERDPPILYLPSPFGCFSFQKKEWDCTETCNLRILRLGGGALPLPGDSVILWAGTLCWFCVSLLAE